MAKKAVKCSKGFKNFLDDVKGKTYEDKILNLIRLNNPAAHKEFIDGIRN